MEKKYIMVTGPAASGKSTLCQLTANNLPAYLYRPVQAYFDVAKLHNIPKERIFQDTNIEEIYNYFCNICQMNNITIGDQHLAIQPKKDSAIALKTNIFIDRNEPYVSAIDYDLFDKMLDSQIDPIIIYLSASPELLFERAYKRYIDTGMIIRNITLEEVQAEVEAEYYYFKQLIDKKQLDYLIINTDIYNQEEAYYKVKKKILK